jgi:hypothetical protein
MKESENDSLQNDERLKPARKAKMYDAGQIEGFALGWHIGKTSSSKIKISSNGKVRGFTGYLSPGVTGGPVSRGYVLKKNRTRKCKNSVLLILRPLSLSSCWPVVRQGDHGAPRRPPARR